MGELSPWHLLIVALAFILLFGAKRLPDAARSLGRSIRILQSELHADDPSAGPTQPEDALSPVAVPLGPTAPGAAAPVMPTGNTQP